MYSVWEEHLFLVGVEEGCASISVFRLESSQSDAYLSLFFIIMNLLPSRACLCEPFQPFYWDRQPSLPEYPKIGLCE